jgi:hypothetical protein
MKSLLLSSLVLGGAFLFPVAVRGNQQPALRLVAEDNVNSRYTVESIEVGGAEPPALTSSLRERVASLIGARFDPAAFEELARDIRKEFRLRSVTTHVARGSAPDRVRVVLETERRTIQFDLSVPKFLYHSTQGWSAQVQASTTIARDHLFRFGVLSDGDELTERFAGFNALYENLHTGSNRVHTGILIEEFHEQWNRSTIEAEGAAGKDLYRARRNVEPTVVFVVAKPLAITFGASFQEMQMSAPGQAPRSANAFFTNVRYDRRLEQAGGNGTEEFDLTYGLRAATAALGSDYRYTRHRVNFRYSISRGRSTLSDTVLAGSIFGNAPLFDRFVLGTSSLLRGWNRYEIDPLGGNHVAHNSVDYSFRINPGILQVFYDAGALWNTGQGATLRHSLGIGYRQSVFSLAIAFPVREGRIDPVFMVGMNY